MEKLTPKDNQLIALLEERIVVCDGGMGTEIQKKSLTLDDFLGCEGCNELLSISRPDIIKDIHASYFAAGADIVETDSFDSTPLVLDEYNKGKEAFKLNYEAAKIAKEVAYS
nr:homocysteine S-methyltransferase family protein [Pseudomonadota bacterium]